MKSSTLIIAGIALFLGAFTFHEIKKRRDQINEIKKSREKELEKEGVNVETLEDEMIPEEDDNNLVKRLFKAIKSNPTWDIDTIDASRCLEKHNVIHLMQFDKESISIMIEIPETRTKDCPRIQNYVDVFKTTTENLWNKYGGNLKKVISPVSYLEGYFAMTYTNTRDPDEDDEDNLESGYLKIHRCLYRSVGLIKYVETAWRKESKLTENIDYMDFESLNMFNVKGLEIDLFYRIDFPIETLNHPGIDLVTLLKYIKGLLEIEVYKLDNYGKNIQTSKVEYNNIFFHAPNPHDNHNWDLLYYYYINSKGDIDVSSYSFEYD